MKINLFIVALLFYIPLLGQTEEEQRFLDTLAMDGSYLVGQSFPSFEITSVDGKQFSNESVKKKWIFINFWFEDCPPCIAELQALNELYADFCHREDFELISISFETPDTIKEWTINNSIKFPICHLQMDDLVRLNFRKGFPTNILIDKDGNIAAIQIGGSRDPEKACGAFKLKFYPILYTSSIKRN